MSKKNKHNEHTLDQFQLEASMRSMKEAQERIKELDINLPEALSHLHSFNYKMSNQIRDGIHRVQKVSKDFRKNIFAGEAALTSVRFDSDLLGKLEKARAILVDSDIDLGALLASSGLADESAQQSFNVATMDSTWISKENVWVEDSTAFVEEENPTVPLPLSGKDRNGIVNIHLILELIQTLMMIASLMWAFNQSKIAPVVNQVFIDTSKPTGSQIKTVKKFSLSDYGIFLIDARFISASNVFLRESANTRCAKLDILNLGQVVAVIDEKKNWVKIEYETVDGSHYKGWVFKRYVSKFSP